MEMGTSQIPEIAKATGNGTTELVTRVLRQPEHGAGYFFPATASGTPLWMAGFAFSLGLYSIVNAEWLATGSLGIVVPVAYAIGAAAMLIGALWDFRAHDLFGGVAGAIFAMFWFSYALLEQFFSADIQGTTGAAGYSDAFGVYLVLWGLLALPLAAAAWFVLRAACGAMLLLCGTFVVLGIASMFAPGTGSEDVRLVGGYVGIACAAAFWYLFAAQVVNSTAGRSVLPTGPGREKAPAS